MATPSRSELFWNAPYRFSSTRAVDPLGFDAFREAMSNVLVPFLTGATTHAEHYVAVMVGLRWAKCLASPPVDEQIWIHFSRFERGLKQYWHRHPSGRSARNRYLGKRRIAVICCGPRPNVDIPILVDQRGVGLLGNYVESVRAIGLVQRATLNVDEPSVAQLLGDPQFEWNGKTPGTWYVLDSLFEKVDQRGAWRHLGRLLFDCESGGDDKARMYAAARTLQARRNGASWNHFSARTTLLEPQRRIAAATQITTQLEDGLRNVFGGMLLGDEPKVSNSVRSRLARLARQLIAHKVITTIWPQEPPVARVLAAQLEMAARERISADAVLRWHHDIMKARATEPWLDALGERSMLTLSAARNEPDFRLTNLRSLLRETKWVA
jgi:hypothetical protein